MRLKQREELEKAVIKRKGEEERGEEENKIEEEKRHTKDATAKRKIDSTDSEPKPKEIAKKRPKHPDEVELDRLIDLKLKKEEELKKVTTREDRFFEKRGTRRRLQMIKHTSYQTLEGRSRQSLKQLNSNGKSTKSRHLRES